MSCESLTSQKNINSEGSKIPIEPLLADTRSTLRSTKSIQLRGLETFIKVATLEFEVQLNAAKEAEVVLEGCIGDGLSRLGDTTTDNTVLTFDLTTLTVDRT